MFKKIISLMLSTSLMLCLSITPTTIFANNLKSVNQVNSDGSYSEIVNIDGEDIEYLHYEIGDLSYLTFNDGPDTIVITTNNVTGEIRLNGEYAATRPQDNSVSTIDSKISTKATWVKFNTKYSNLVNSVMSVASWAGIIAALMGAPVATPIIMQIAKQLVSDNLGIVYYIIDEYYLSPVTTSRPKVAKTYKYYKYSSYTGYLGMYDGRY